MKILIVHPQMGQFGGAELVVVRMSQLLQSWGHEVDILTLSATDHKDYEGLNFILPRRQTEYRLRTGIRYFPDIASIYMSLRGMCNSRFKSYDAINIHNFPAMWAAPTHGKVVWMCNEIPDLWHTHVVSLATRLGFQVGKKVDRYLVRARHPLVVVADRHCAARVAERYNLSAHVNHYGIDAFEPSNARSKTFTILHPAMVSPSKNQLEVLRAMVELRKVMDTRLIVSGYYEPSHPYTLLLQEYIREHHLDVQFVGLGSRAVLQELYAQAHVAVFPGRGQGSWLGPFEQLTLGTPIVVSPKLSCSELVNTMQLGTVTEDLADAIRDIHDNYPEHSKRALRGREFVLHELTWERFTRHMLELMQ